MAARVEARVFRAKGKKRRWADALSAAENFMNAERIEVLDVKCHVTQGKSRVAVLVLYRQRSAEAADASPRSPRDGQGRYTLSYHDPAADAGSPFISWERTIDHVHAKLGDLARQRLAHVNGELVSCSFSQSAHARKKDELGAKRNVWVVCSGTPPRRRGQGDVLLTSAEGHDWELVKGLCEQKCSEIVAAGGTVVDVDMLAVEPREYSSPTCLMVIAYTAASALWAEGRQARATTPVVLEWVKNSSGALPAPLPQQLQPVPTDWERELPLLAEACDAAGSRLICAAFAPALCNKGGPAWMLTVSFAEDPHPEQFTKVALTNTLQPRGSAPEPTARSPQPSPRGRSPRGRSPRPARTPAATSSSLSAAVPRPASPFNRTNRRRDGKLAAADGSLFHAQESLTQTVSSRLNASMQRMELEPEPEPEFATDRFHESGFRDLLNQTGEAAIHVTPQQAAALDKVVGERAVASSSSSSRVGKARRFSRLHNAAWVGNSADVARLIKEGAAIQKGDKSRNTPLHVACEQGHLNAAQVLLDTLIADPNACNSRKETPLHAAAAGGHLRVVRLLLDHGGTLGPADTRAKDVDGKTAADVAAARHYFEVAEELGGESQQVDRVHMVHRPALVLAEEETETEQQAATLRPKSPLPRTRSGGGLQRTQSPSLRRAEQVLAAHGAAALDEEGAEAAPTTMPSPRRYIARNRHSFVQIYL